MSFDKRINLNKTRLKICIKMVAFNYFKFRPQMNPRFPYFQFFSCFGSRRGGGAPTLRSPVLTLLSYSNIYLTYPKIRTKHIFVVNFQYYGYCQINLTKKTKFISIARKLSILQTYWQMNIQQLCITHVTFHRIQVSLVLNSNQTQQLCLVGFTFQKMFYHLE